VLSDGHRRAEHDLWIRRAERISAPLPPLPAAPQTLWAVLHPATSWPWYLLFGTLVFAFGTVTTALYLTTMPARAATVPVTQQCQPATAAPGPAACDQPS
jgi:drug/metabolite transporter (DMT)-like permease